MTYPLEFPYRIRGYAGRSHPAVVTGYAKIGDLLGETKHTDGPSRDMEITVWKLRMTRGEACRIEVTEPDLTRVIYPAVAFYPTRRRRR